MLIIGCDYHPGVQQIAFMDTETGEFGERRLEHGDGEAEKFYRDLRQAGISVRVGMEATGHAPVCCGRQLFSIQWGGQSGAHDHGQRLARWRPSTFANERPQLTDGDRAEKS